MSKNKIVTYSLLAHINNNSTLTTGLLDLFIPLVKNALSYLYQNGTTSGESILEIQKAILKEFSLDIPIDIVRRLLRKIEETSTIENQPKLYLYKDQSFEIKDYTFFEFEEVIEKKKNEIAEVEEYFKKFCNIHNVQRGEYSSIFEFIDRNKLSIARYLGSTNEYNEDGKTKFLLEAQFTEYFKNIPAIYETIKDIYLGSIISTYIEYKTKDSKTNIELLYDTNFVVGLLNLNTPESSQTCNKLVEISKSLGFKQYVMHLTITETQNLLKARAENFDTAFLARKVNPEDIYTACDRQGLNKSDLQRISDNLQEILENKGIHILHNVEKYRNMAKHSKEYEHILKFRNTKAAALHDVTATYYVNDKRAKRIYDFEDVNCWFVHNSNTPVKSGGELDSKAIRYQPEHIKADDLLNILWLTTPGFSENINKKELVDFGLNALISCTISESLPKSSLIRELDANIGKYLQDDSISEQDVLRIATRISNRELTDIKEVNQLEKTSPQSFVERLKQESEKQKHTEEQQRKMIQHVIESTRTVKNQLIDKQEQLLNKEKQLEEEREYLATDLETERRKAIVAENKVRSLQRDAFYGNNVKNWQLRGWYQFLIATAISGLFIVIILALNHWNGHEAMKDLKEMQGDIIFLSLFTTFGIAFTTIFCANLVNRYFNQSMIKAFKDNLKLPNEFKEIKQLEELDDE